MKEIKRYLFDTNVLLINPNLINQYSEKIVIAKTIVDELDYRKTKLEHREVAQLALNHIERNNIIPISNKNSSGNNDEKILQDVLSAFLPIQMLLVSNDTGMRVQAKAKEIKTFSLDEFLQWQDSNDCQQIPECKELFDLIQQQKFDMALKSIAKDKNLHFNFYLSNGNTPLIECIRTKKFSSVDFLLEQKSINLDMIDKAKLNMTAFSHAAQRRQLKIMDKLIKAGANPYITSQGKNSGNSPLLIAAWDGAIDVIKFIVEHSKLQCSLNQADNNGFTPLIKACIKGHEDIVDYLIMKKVDCHIRDRKNKLALDYAIENGYKNIIKLLQEAS
jgi:hypothetical protein